MDERETVRSRDYGVRGDDNVTLQIIFVSRRQVRYIHVGKEKVTAHLLVGS